MKYLVFLLAFSTLSESFAELPVCRDKKKALEFNSDLLLNYRDHMEPKFKARGFVKGRLVQALETRPRHLHLEVDFDQNLETIEDRLEIIYNIEFGHIPDARPGDEIIARGDFVVDHYSPFKAVIHWLHYSPKPKRHEDGYLAINGVVYGLQNDL